MKTPKKPTSPTGNPATRDPDTLQRFKDYIARHNLSADSSKDHKILANRLGSNATYVLRYLTDDFRGNLADFEAKITACLDAEVTTIKANKDLIAEDFIVEPVTRFLRQVKKHSYIGVGYGPAGKGKTIAARLFVARHDATAIYIHINHWSANPSDLAADIARALMIRGLPARPTIKALSTALVNKLTDGHRLIILDNAQRMKESTRKWLADLWEATKCPIALLGNPEILTQFRANDQHASRIGLRRDVTLEMATTAKATAGHMLRLHFPAGEGVSDITKDATLMLTAPGSARTVAMCCHAAKAILEGGLTKDPVEAFKAAQTQLITAA